MFSFILSAVNIVYVIVCVLLILIILMQASKGGGLAGAFGGGGETAFGAQAGSQFKKFTQVIAVLFVLIIIFLNLAQKVNTEATAETEKADVEKDAPQVPGTPAPKAKAPVTVPPKTAVTPKPSDKKPKDVGGVGQDRPE